MKCRDFFNLPNVLTNIRILLVPVFAFLLLQDGVYYKMSALGIFIVASVTDYFDGVIARKKKLVTIYGIFMDPLADKILLGTAFITFLFTRFPGFEHWFSVLIIILILIREIGITILRSYLITKDINLPAKIWGKVKTVLQMGVVSFIIVTIVFLSFMRHIEDVPSETVIDRLATMTWWLLLLTMIVTIVSGVQYIISLSHHYSGTKNNG